MFKKLVVAGGVVGIGALIGMDRMPKYLENRRMSAMLNRPGVSSEDLKRFNGPLPSREQQLAAMKSKEFDVLIIGGGATGTGVALDAASRGLSTCMLEKYDFASGTSSRSTKLIHGGVRYLQKAVFNLDIEQYRMVKEALRERANMVDVAPHIAQPLPIMLPIYTWWQIPYFWSGIKMYDLVSGTQILKSSYYLNKTQALERFPMLNKDKLVGALVYYDGMQDDARMCLTLALTATRYGAAVANYTEVIHLIKGPPPPSSDPTDKPQPKEVVQGARVRDLLTGQEFDIKAKCVINATGPFTDLIRTMGDPEVAQICQPSSGVHIVLPGYYSPENMGLLDPATKDGRVIFFLPWQGCTMAGTTDQPCPVTDHPAPSEDEVKFILEEIRGYLSPEIQVRRGDVLSAWAGIRPLVRDPNSKDTQSIARNHIIEVAPNRLITIAGGKWTTYRSMAEETVDRAVLECGLKPTTGCRTRGLLLEGAHQWSPNMFITLVQNFGMETDVATHLAHTYGDKAVKVARLSDLTGLRWPVTGVRLHDDFPYTEAEVIYACREYACRAVDVLARRTRLAFLNVHAAQESLPRIIEIMSKELKWDKRRQLEESRIAGEFLATEMGMMLKLKSENVPINFTREETNALVRKFQKIDSSGKGFITVNDLRNYFKEQTGERIPDSQLSEILNEVDVNKNGEIDMGEFLQFMSALKSGVVANSRFKQVLAREPISVDRSGGGL